MVTENTIFVAYMKEPDGEIMLVKAFPTMEQVDEFCGKGNASGWQSTELIQKA